MALVTSTTNRNRTKKSPMSNPAFRNPSRNNNGVARPKLDALSELAFFRFFYYRGIIKLDDRVIRQTQKVKVSVSTGRWPPLV
jgi:hypothetical protein